MAELMTIGQVADAVDMATSTLRYYDDIGLVEPTTRISGQRRYTDRAVRRLRVIDSCQQAGFTLEEIGQLLDSTGDWQSLARRKRHELHARIQQLQQAVQLVDAALACGCDNLEGCERERHPADGHASTKSHDTGCLTDPTLAQPSDGLHSRDR